MSGVVTAVAVVYLVVSTAGAVVWWLLMDHDDYRNDLGGE